jgi:hypothetical protein
LARRAVAKFAQKADIYPQKFKFFNEQVDSPFYLPACCVVHVQAQWQVAATPAKFARFNRPELLVPLDFTNC